MKYLKRKIGKNSTIRPIDVLSCINAYIADPINFPELENIINICEDITDWYYVNNCQKPLVRHQLNRIGEENKLFSLNEDSIEYINFLNDNKSFIYNLYYYKSYQINFQMYSKLDKKIFYEKIDNTIKRLENYGFLICRLSTAIASDSMGRNFISILDKNDSIKLKEIIKNETLN